MKKITAALLFLYLITISAPIFAASNKDVILVLDTSLSMVGYGGKNIFENVKDSIKKYIDQLKDDDSLTFVTFDETVRIYPTVLLESKNDRDIVKKYISMTEAKGKWTYTLQMLEAVFAKAEEIEKEKKSKQIVLVIMTDSIDDPPPANKKDMYDFRKKYSKYADKNDWWIFLIGLNELKSDPKIASSGQKLAKDLSGVSKNIYTIESDGNVKAAIEDKLQADIKDLEWQKTKTIIIVAAIAAALLILIIIFILLYQAKLKLHGKIEYWNNTILNPYTSILDITKLNIRKMSIGKGVDCNLNIRDINISSPFVLSAVKSGSEMNVEITSGAGYDIQFINREPARILKDGDIFKVENYTFKYSA